MGPGRGVQKSFSKTDPTFEIKTVLLWERKTVGIIRKDIFESEPIFTFKTEVFKMCSVHSYNVLHNLSQLFSFQVEI